MRSEIEKILEGGVGAYEASQDRIFFSVDTTTDQILALFEKMCNEARPEIVDQGDSYSLGLIDGIDHYAQALKTKLGESDG